MNKFKDIRFRAREGHYKGYYFELALFFSTWWIIRTSPRVGIMSFVVGYEDRDEALVGLAGYAKSDNWERISPRKH